MNKLKFNNIVLGEYNFSNNEIESQVTFFKCSGISHDYSTYITQHQKQVFP